MPIKSRYSEEQVEQMLMLYQDGKSMAAIGKEFGCSTTAVHNLFKKVPGFKARSTKDTARKYTADWDFFETIDTELKAYWLGFLYADGYISKKPSNLMGCSLAEKDFVHLANLAGDLQATNPIIQYDSTGYTDNPYVRFTVISDKMVADLERHGMVSLKTNILKPPTTVPDDLIRHFIRGYFDGDGGWSKTSTKIGYKFCVTGTEEMMLWIAEQIGITPRLYKRHPERNTNNFTLEANGKSDLAKIIPYLYKHSHRLLNRKYELAMKIRPLVE